MAANIALMVATKIFDPMMSKPVNGFYMMIVSSTFSLFVVFLASKSSSQERKMLCVFAAFAIFRALAEISWYILESVLHVETSPSIADFFYLTGYVFISIFLFKYLNPLRKNAPRSVKVVATMVALTHLIPTSLAVYMLNPDLDYVKFLVALAYPIGDAVFLWQVIVGLTLLFNKKNHLFLTLLLGGVIGFIISDTLYVFMTTSYETGSLIDLGWISGYILFMFSALCYRPLLQNEIEKSKGINLEAMIKFVIPMITIAVIFVAGAAITSHYLSDSQEGDATGVMYNLYVFPSIIGVFIAIIFVQNKNLLKFVKLRTVELEAERDKLQAELDDKIDALMKVERLSAIGELSARIAHDLRNPLTIVKSGFEIIRLKDQSFTKETQDTLSRIDRALVRMTHQIENVLDFVSPKPLLVKTVTLSDLLKQVMDRISVPKDITVTLPQNDFEFNCDPFKMEIVLVNLIVNAIQAMENKGQLILRGNETKNGIIIKVQDTGPGIPPDVIGKIFDPLFTTRFIGTGLGLPSCKSIVEKHGGTISIDTKVGVGTVFTINMPKIEYPTS